MFAGFDTKKKDKSILFFSCKKTMITTVVTR